MSPSPGGAFRRGGPTLQAMSVLVGPAVPGSRQFVLDKTCRVTSTIMAISCVGADRVGHVRSSAAHCLWWSRRAVTRRLVFEQNAFPIIGFEDALRAL